MPSLDKNVTKNLLKILKLQPNSLKIKGSEDFF